MDTQNTQEANVEVIEALTEAEAKKVAARMQGLNETINKAYYSMGEMLLTMSQGQGFYHFGYTSFEDYTYQELGFRPRKAKYWMDIYTSCVKHGVEEEELAEVGWTKVKEFSTIPNLTDEEFKELLDKAKDTPFREFKAHVDENYRSDKKSPMVDEDGHRVVEGEDGEKFYPVSFSLSKDQHDAFLAATSLAQKLTGSDKLPFHIDVMVMSFLGNQGDAETYGDIIADLANRGFVEFDDDEE